MTATHFSGPVMAGTKQAGETNGPNMGYAVLEQTVTLAQNSTNAVSKTIYIPPGSQIIDILVDVLTAFDSATSATLTVGESAGGAEYASGVNAKTAGRTRPTFTAAQLASMNNVTVLGVADPTPAPVVVTITPTGATSAGFVAVTILYSQQ